MGYMTSWMNANELTEQDTLERETPQEHIESLNLSSDEKIELDVE